MNPQFPHWTRSTQNGALFQVRLATKGATRARLSCLMGPSQMTHFETSIIDFALLPNRSNWIREFND